MRLITVLWASVFAFALIMVSAANADEAASSDTKDQIEELNRQLGELNDQLSQLTNKTKPKPRPKPKPDPKKQAEEKMLKDMKEIFGRPKTPKEYYERNFQWIRCRTKIENRFDVGGAWPGHHGKNWLDELKKRRSCGLINWSFEYINRDGWGDAEVYFDWFFGCGQKKAVEDAIETHRYGSATDRRELYIYNCPGFEGHPNYIDEQKAWDKIRQAQGGSE